MAEQGSTVVRITANSQYHYARTRQEELDRVLNQLNKENKRVVNIIDGPLTRLSPFDTVVCDVTILWEKGNAQSAGVAQPSAMLVVTAENFASIVKRIDLFLEDGEWTQADAYCEQALNHDATNAGLYVRKLMAELHVHKQDDLKNCPETFQSSKNYQKAVRYADNALSDALKNYIAAIEARKRAAEQARKDAKKAEVYTAAIEAMKKADDKETYRKLGNVFSSISDFSNSSQMAQQCYAKAEACRKDAIYAKAKELMEYTNPETVEKARLQFLSIPGWKDADELAASCPQRIEELKAEKERKWIASEKAAKRNRKILLLLRLLLRWALWLTGLLPW